jgi:hypothetical protein
MPILARVGIQVRRRDTAERDHGDLQVMRRFIINLAIFGLFGLLGAAPAGAQSIGTTVTVRTIPNSLYFWVDGQMYYSDHAAGCGPL